MHHTWPSHGDWTEQCRCATASGFQRTTVQPQTRGFERGGALLALVVPGEAVTKRPCVRVPAGPARAHRDRIETVMVSEWTGMFALSLIRVMICTGRLIGCNMYTYGMCVHVTRVRVSTGTLVNATVVVLQHTLQRTRSKHTMLTLCSESCNWPKGPVQA